MFPSENLREGLSEKDKGDLIFPSVLFHVAQQGKCRLGKYKSACNWRFCIMWRRTLLNFERSWGGARTCSGVEVTSKLSRIPAITHRKNYPHHPQEELPYQYLRLEFPTRRLASHCLSLAIAPSSAPRPSLWPTSVQYLRHNYVHVFFQWYPMQCQQYSNMPRSSIPSPTGSLSSGIQARLFVIWDIIHPMHHCIHFTIWVCLYILLLFLNS